MYGGYIVLTPQGGGQTFHVPYAGFKGDYQSIQAMTPTPLGLPWLAKLVGPNLVNQPAGATYTLQGGDVPYFLFHLDHQVQRLEFAIVDAATLQPIHHAFSNALEIEYLGRNSTPTGFFAVAWDGTRVYSRAGRAYEVPNGQYRIIIKALKALGDERNPAHTETWTSPVITLARP
jgi:hypothetical protein